MTERRRNILIGLFVLGGLVALAILVVLFGAFPNVIAGGTYKVHIVFRTEVEDIPVDTDVFMIGRRIGRVTEVDWRAGRPSEGVEVTLSIDNGVEIPSTAVAVFKEASMGLGRSRLQLTVPLGTDAPPLPKDGSALLAGRVVQPFEQIIPPEMGETLQRTTAQIGELADALTPAARDIHQLLRPTSPEQVDADQAVGNLASALQRLDTSLASINAVIAKPEVQQDIITTAANIRAASVDLQTALKDIQAFAASARKTADSAQAIPDDIKALLADVRTRVDTVSRNLIANTDNLNRVLVNLNTAIETINRGEGTLGLLLSDNRLYEALVLTAQRLSGVMADLQSLVRAWQEQGVRIESLRLR